MMTIKEQTDRQQLRSLIFAEEALLYQHIHPLRCTILTQFATKLEENGTGMPDKMFKYPADGVRNYTGMPDPELLEYYESQNSESRVV